MTENATVSHSHTHALEATGLKKHYGPRNVVKGVSLAVKSSEVVGLLGKNGAGKTTTFYMVVGLVVADDGQIRLDGQDITHMPIYKRARMGLSYLPQEASVFRKLSVEDNVRAILELQEGEDGKPLSKDVIEERLDQLLEELQIQHLRTNQAISLSGGERRRTEIARALAANPRFILLDEPFAGVDPIAVIEIQRIVRFLKERNIGVLITDHNVRETLSICDHAYIINEGEVLASGTPDELVNDQAVRKIYLGEKLPDVAQMGKIISSPHSPSSRFSPRSSSSRCAFCRCPRRSFSAKSNSCSNPTPLLEVEEPAQASDDPQARAQEHDDDRRDDRGEDDSEFDAAQAETPVDQPYEAWQGASSDEAPLRAHSRPRILQGRAARRSRLPAAHAAPASARRLPCRGARRQGLLHVPVRDAHALLRAHPQGGRRRERDRRRVARSPRHPSEHGSSGHRHRRPRRGPHEADRAHRALHHACRRA